MVVNRAYDRAQEALVRLGKGCRPVPAPYQLMLSLSDRAHPRKLIRRVLDVRAQPELAPPALLFLGLFGEQGGDVRVELGVRDVGRDGGGGADELVDDRGWGHGKGTGESGGRLTARPGVLRDGVSRLAFKTAE